MDLGWSQAYAGWVAAAGTAEMLLDCFTNVYRQFQHMAFDGFEQYGRFMQVMYRDQPCFRRWADEHSAWLDGAFVEHLRGEQQRHSKRRARLTGIFLASSFLYISSRFPVHPSAGTLLGTPLTGQANALGDAPQSHLGNTPSGTATQAVGRLLLICSHENKGFCVLPMPIVTKAFLGFLIRK
jgi:hypothetical protein